MPDVELLEELRPPAFAIAYRMLGSVSEAEDVVQEALPPPPPRAARRGERIESPRAYLATVVTRLAIDQLRSARVRRETYVGEWLPEPLVDERRRRPGPPGRDGRLAVARLPRRCSRACRPSSAPSFLLREVFDYPYDEIAEIVGKSEDNARQLAARARRHVEERRPRFEASREQRERARGPLLRRRRRRATSEALEALLAEDVVLHGDGGGKAPALARARPRPRPRGAHAARLVRRRARASAASRCAASRSTASRARCSSTARAALISVMALDIADGPDPGA